MGCANSKDSHFRRYKDDGHASPMRRSVTLYPRYHLEGCGRRSVDAPRTSATVRREDKDTFVAATRRSNGREGEDQLVVHEKSGFEDKSMEEVDVKLDEGEIWASLMDERVTKIVPKTPVRTPPGEPESINLWEVMEGLEDTSPLIKPVVHHSTSFSFDVACDPDPVLVSLPIDGPKSIFREGVKESNDTGELPKDGFSDSNGMDSTEGPEKGLSCTEAENDRSLPNKPKWLEMSSDDEKAYVPEFDPEIISMFRKSMEDISPENRFYFTPKTPVTEDGQRRTVAAKNTFQPSKKDKVVVYFTSLRGIRKTYEDCCHVRVILKGLGVRVDEKDLSMHSGFKEELKELLGDTYNGGGLPKVFVGKKFIGGADEIRTLHEEVKLEKLVEGCEMVDINGNGCNASCEACGDIRFIPCETCSGSCKKFYDYDEDEESTKDLDGDGFGFHRCPDCNENGLIRCPLCCD